VSIYYKKVGEISEEFCSQAAAIAHNSENWQIADRPGLCVYSVTMDGREELEKLTELTDLWPVDLWQGHRFVKIDPGGYLHRHTDGREAYWHSYHIILLTNDQAISSMYDPDGTEHAFNLEACGIYEIDRVCEHGSVNNGDSERLHLLIEVNDA
jgi:hypothetical protein